MKNSLWIISLAAVMLVAMAAPAPADQLAQTGRQIAGKWQTAVVTVQLIVKTTVTYDGQQAPTEEDKLEANAVIIDASGLAVAPLSEINPEESLGDLLGEDADKYKVSCDITDVKILGENGVEIPAQVVLRDKELDLAFIKATAKPDKPMTAVDLEKGSKPQLLDEILALSRQGLAASRAVAASLDRIETVVEKPRFFSIPDQGLDMGASVFTMDGNFAGLVVMRQLPAAAGSTDWYSNSTQIIIPAADIKEAAKQVP